MLTEEDIFIGARFNVPTTGGYPFTWDLSLGDEKEPFTTVRVDLSYASFDVLWDNPYHGKLVYVVREDHPTTGQYVSLEALKTIGPVIQDDGQYSFIPML